jgi:hypothetical protein
LQRPPAGLQLAHIKGEPGRVRIGMGGLAEL